MTHAQVNRASCPAQDKTDLTTFYLAALLVFIP
jgi:hypothetical protein